jgi:hypothetical protein
MFVQYLVIKLLMVISKLLFQYSQCRQIGIRATAKDFSISVVILRIFTEGYIELCVCAFINFHDLILSSGRERQERMFSGAGNLFNSVLTLITVLLLFFIPCYVIRIALLYGKSHRDCIELRLTKSYYFQIHHIFFEEVRSHNLMAAQYIGWVMFKKMLIVLVVMGASDHLFLQMMTLLTLQFLHIWYITANRPMLFRASNIQHFMDEFITILILYQLLVLTDSSIELEAKKKLGWSVILTMALGIAINLLRSAQEAVQVLIKAVRDHYQKSRLKKIKEKHRENMVLIVRQFPG